MSGGPTPFVQVNGLQCCGKCRRRVTGCSTVPVDSVENAYGMFQTTYAVLLEPCGHEWISATAWEGGSRAQ
jgi:hypothetical protein